MESLIFDTTLAIARHLSPHDVCRWARATRDDLPHVMRWLGNDHLWTLFENRDFGQVDAQRRYTPPSPPPSKIPKDETAVQRYWRRYEWWRDYEDADTRWDTSYYRELGRRSARGELPGASISVDLKWNPLMWAAACGHVPQLTELLKRSDAIDMARQTVWNTCDALFYGVALGGSFEVSVTLMTFYVAHSVYEGQQLLIDRVTAAARDYFTYRSSLCDAYHAQELRFVMHIVRHGHVDFLSASKGTDSLLYAAAKEWYTLEPLDAMMERIGNYQDALVPAAACSPSGNPLAATVTELLYQNKHRPLATRQLLQCLIDQTRAPLWIQDGDSVSCLRSKATTLAHLLVINEQQWPADIVAPMLLSVVRKQPTLVRCILSTKRGLGTPTCVVAKHWYQCPVEGLELIKQLLELDPMRVDESQWRLSGWRSHDRCVALMLIENWHSDDEDSARALRFVDSLDCLFEYCGTDGNATLMFDVARHWAGTRAAAKLLLRYFGDRKSNKWFELVGRTNDAGMCLFGVITAAWSATPQYERARSLMLSLLGGLIAAYDWKLTWRGTHTKHGWSIMHLIAYHWLNMPDWHADSLGVFVSAIKCCDRCRDDLWQPTPLLFASTSYEEHLTLADFIRRHVRRPPAHGYDQREAAIVALCALVPQPPPVSFLRTAIAAVMRPCAKRRRIG